MRPAALRRGGFALALGTTVALASTTAFSLTKPEARPEAKALCSPVPEPLFGFGGGSASKKPVTVLITGAAGQIGYSLIFMIAQGAMLGPDQPINLKLLDLPGAPQDMLNAIKMELVDTASPLVKSVTCTSDYKEAFSDVEIALLVGARPRGPGMERKDLLKANAAIFEGQGKAIEQYASKNIKVCVVGNPANTNAGIAMAHAPSIPKTAWTALTRLDQNRAVGQIAERTSSQASDVKKVIVWGNHSSTQYPDVNHATVGGKAVRSVVGNDDFLDEEFVKVVQTRGAAVIAARKMSSAASAANAVVGHVRDWYVGTPAGTFSSMAVVSDGSYGVPKDIVFSFPCVCKNGEYKIVQGLPIDAKSQKRLDTTAQELLAEKADALGN